MCAAKTTLETESLALCERLIWGRGPQLLIKHTVPSTQLPLSASEMFSLSVCPSSRQRGEGTGWWFC